MRLVTLSLLAIALIAGAAGCGGSSDNKTVDSGGAATEVTAGDAALASGDYAAANAHYKAALAKDPGNTEAQFGAGVTEVYVLKDDPEIQAVNDQIQLAQAPIITPLARTPIHLPLGSRGDRAVAFARRLAGASAGVDPHYSPQRLGAAFFRTLRLAADEPDSISEIQAIIRTKVMPRLQYAEERLNAVESAPDFRKLLPPSVTDQPDTIEIDKTEIYALDAVVNELQAWCGMLIAYNFDVENSDFEHVDVESLLTTPGSAWGTLNPGGALALSAARLNLMNVKGKLDAMAVYLAAEADDQGNDVIKQEWLNTQDYADLHDAVDKVYTSLSAPVIVTVQDYVGADMNIQVQIGRFFTPAMTDLKAFFPDLVFDVDGPDISSPITFGDHPTINGIFPDMTDVRWQQLTGLSSPPVAMRRAGVGQRIAAATR